MQSFAGAAVRRASDLIETGDGAQPFGGRRWSRRGLSRSLVELVSGPDSASLSVVAGLIVQAQRVGELVAWVCTRNDIFFPPDFATRGVDLSALPVVWAGSGYAEHTARRAGRAAEHLLRSGAFGLVVIDLADDLHLSQANQGRLLRLAEHHDAIVLVIRRKRRSGSYSGSLVSVRLESRRTERFHITITCTKDKREGPGWTVVEQCNGPPGMY